MTRRIVSLMIAASLCVAPLIGDPPDSQKHFYKLDFTIREIDSAKTLNSRTYSVFTATRQKTEIRVGTKLPVKTSSGGYTQLDLGVSIDCLDLVDVGNEVSLRIIADITSVAQQPEKFELPILRQNKWDSSAILPLNQTVTVFSSDDLDSKSKLQLQLMVSPVRSAAHE